MIEKSLVEEIVKEYIADTDYFVVDVSVDNANRIVVEIDSDQGITVDDCIAMTRFVESRLDRDAEDYELEVGSAGIGRPFKVLRQYKKNVGREVEVLAKDGKKYTGVIKEVGDDAFTLTIEKQVKPEGAKRKITVEEDLVFPYNEIKYTKNTIDSNKFMAKKQEAISMIDTFAEFKELKNIDRTTLISVLEEAFRNVISKMFGTDENYDIIINPDKGDFEIWRNREVVPDDEVEDSNMQIGLTEAQKIDEDYEVGEEITDEVHFAKFGRRAVLNLRQALASKILELQKDSLYNKYKDKVGEIVSGEVYQVWKKEILLLDDEDNELLLPKSEQIPGDFFRKGETRRAVVVKVDNLNNNPKIILSRTSPLFMQRLFEREVPEIQDGLITIKRIARIPGERAKVAVESYDDRIDPVGACVGMKGARIHGIVRELCNENIDVINYTSNVPLFIQRALSPAKISSIKINEEEKRAEVFLRPEEVSLAIGKGGLNIKLASMLTEYTIDVFRDVDVDGEDIYLDEFSDEIDPWIIDALKNIGCYTAKNVLAMSRNDLIEKADLEENTVDEVLAVLAAEFEEE
jgi:transcription termination factor NusA